MIENDVYYEPDADWCWYCDRHQPEEGVRVFLCSAGHSPCNAEANYICEDHLDSDAVKYVRDTEFPTRVCQTVVAVMNGVDDRWRQEIADQ